MDSQQAQAFVVGEGGEQEVKGDLRKFLLDTFVLDPQQQIDEEASLLGSGVLDSTGILEVVAHLEQTYDFQVEDEEIVPENFDSLVALARFVARKTGG